MPVTGPYYCIARYYGPNAKMNGRTVHDTLYKGTELESMFKRRTIRKMFHAHTSPIWYTTKKEKK